MKSRTQRFVDLSGLNLIRIVIGSYFMGISLGLVEGMAPGAIFAGILPAQTADLIGSTFLFTATMAFMMGYHLRLAAITVALFVLINSIFQNIISAQVAQMSAFWTDLTMIGGVLLCYYSFKRHEFRQATIKWRRAQGFAACTADTVVRPRRIITARTSSVRPVRTPDPLRLHQALDADQSDSHAPVSVSAPQAQEETSGTKESVFDLLPNVPANRNGLTDRDMLSDDDADDRFNIFAEEDFFTDRKAC